ncbi:MAG: complex I subunit 1 family protein [Candidatus Bathyarchaeia archaeon]
MIILVLLAMFPAVFVLSLLFEGIDRKLHARMQKRIGPPIIQPFYDFVKLFNKERIIPVIASPKIFIAVAIIAAASSILGAAIPLANLATRTSIVGDMILILYLLAMSSIMIMIGGSSSGNPYGAIGFSRKMTMLIGYELPLLISVILLALKSGRSIAYYDVILFQTQIRSCLAFTYPSVAIAAVTFLLCMPAGAGVVPFDIPEAKTEIVHGPLIEYGGPYLALVKLAKDAANFAFAFLALTLFFYFPALFEGSILLGEWATLCLCLAGALVVMFCTITVPRTTFARLKIGQAFKFYWLFPLLLAILALALSIVEM